ncbi:hypothetical protein BGZ94_007626 [Podila epigama]|nr:hypothetical protein BGZ94_007626 [Podila epigama]
MVHPRTASNIEKATLQKTTVSTTPLWADQEAHPYWNELLTEERIADDSNEDDDESFHFEDSDGDDDKDHVYSNIYLHGYEGREHHSNPVNGRDTISPSGAQAFASASTAAVAPSASRPTTPSIAHFPRALSRTASSSALSATSAVSTAWSVFATMSNISASSTHLLLSKDWDRDRDKDRDRDRLPRDYFAFASPVHSSVHLPTSTSNHSAQLNPHLKDAHLRQSQTQHPSQSTEPRSSLSNSQPSPSPRPLSSIETLCNSPPPTSTDTIMSCPLSAPHSQHILCPPSTASTKDTKVAASTTSTPYSPSWPRPQSAQLEHPLLLHTQHQQVIHHPYRGAFDTADHDNNHLSSPLSASYSGRSKKRSKRRSFELRRGYPNGQCVSSAPPETTNWDEKDITDEDSSKTRGLGFTNTAINLRNLKTFLLNSPMFSIAVKGMIVLSAISIFAISLDAIFILADIASDPRWSLLLANDKAALVVTMVLAVLTIAYSCFSIFLETRRSPAGIDSTSKSKPLAVIFSEIIVSIIWAQVLSVAIYIYMWTFGCTDAGEERFGQLWLTSRNDVNEESIERLHLATGRLCRRQSAMALENLRTILYEKYEATAHSHLACFQIKWKKQTKLFTFLNNNNFGRDPQSNDDVDDSLHEEDETSDSILVDNKETSVHESVAGAEATPFTSAEIAEHDRQVRIRKCIQGMANVGKMNLVRKKEALHLIRIKDFLKSKGDIAPTLHQKKQSNNYNNNYNNNYM